MDKPKVSVLLCTYNRASLVGRAVQSALDQTFRDFELIVIDDGSVDNTRDVVTRFGDPRIRYMWQENSGLAGSRHVAVECARGEYVTFLDDDDLYLPHKLAEQVEFMNAHPDVGWSSGGYVVQDMEGNTVAEQRPWQAWPCLGIETWLFQCPTCPSAVIVRRELLRSIDDFDPAQGPCEDWDVWLRLANAGCGMAWLETIVCIYRVHSGNWTKSIAYGHAENGPLRVLDKFFAQPDLPYHIAGKRSAAYAHRHVMNAAACFATGHLDLAAEDLSKTFACKPSLAACNGRKVLDLLIPYAHSMSVDDPIEYARTLVAHLPEETFGPIAARRAAVIGGVHTAAFFRMRTGRTRWQTLKEFACMLWFSPRFLLNLGAWSILGDALLGRGLMNRLRRAYRALSSRGRGVTA